MADALGIRDDRRHVEAGADLEQRRGDRRWHDRNTIAVPRTAREDVEVRQEGEADMRATQRPHVVDFRRVQHRRALDSRPPSAIRIRAQPRIRQRERPRIVQQPLPRLERALQPLQWRLRRVEARDWVDIPVGRGERREVGPSALLRVVRHDPLARTARHDATELVEHVHGRQVDVVRWVVHVREPGRGRGAGRKLINSAFGQRSPGQGIARARRALRVRHFNTARAVRVAGRRRADGRGRRCAEAAGLAPAEVPKHWLGCSGSADSLRWTIAGGQRHTV